MNKIWEEEIGLEGEKIILIDSIASRLHPALRRLESFERGEINLSTVEIEACSNVRNSITEALLRMDVSQLRHLFAKDSSQLRRDGVMGDGDQVWHYDLADFEHWGRMSVWSEEQGAALLLGLDPAWVNSTSLTERAFLSKKGIRFAQIRDLAISAVQAEVLKSPIAPAKFLAWASERDVPIPEDLRRAIRVSNLPAHVDDQQYRKMYAELEELRGKKKLYEDIIKKRGGPQQRLRALYLITRYLWCIAHKQDPKTVSSYFPVKSSLVDISDTTKLDLRTVEGAISEAFKTA